jgi:hypothetical protein
MLYANAGNKLCDDVQHVISIDELRGNHKGVSVHRKTSFFEDPAGMP